MGNIIYINNFTTIHNTNNNNWLFFGGFFAGCTFMIGCFKLWQYNNEKKFGKDHNDSPHSDTEANQTATNHSDSSKVDNTNKNEEVHSRVDASQTSTTFTTKKESDDEPLVEENESPAEDVLKAEPIPSSELSSSQAVQDSNHGISDDELNNKNIWKQLPLPCCFKGLSREEAAKAIDELYAATIGKYFSCSSRNYFYYIFSSTSLPNGYCPPSDSWISCNKGAAFLKALIKRLYNEKNGRILRGTWPNVERIFLVNGEKPHTGLGKNTNKASVQCKREVNSIVTGVLSKVKSR